MLYLYRKLHKQPNEYQEILANFSDDHRPREAGSMNVQKCSCFCSCWRGRLRNTRRDGVDNKHEKAWITGPFRSLSHSVYLGITSSFRYLNPARLPVPPLSHVSGYLTNSPFCCQSRRLDLYGKSPMVFLKSWTKWNKAQLSNRGPAWPPKKKAPTEGCPYKSNPNWTTTESLAHSGQDVPEQHVAKTILSEALWPTRDLCTHYSPTYPIHVSAHPRRTCNDGRRRGLTLWDSGGGCRRCDLSSRGRGRTNRNTTIQQRQREKHCNKILKRE